MAGRKAKKGPSRKQQEKVLFETDRVRVRIDPYCLILDRRPAKENPKNPWVEEGFYPTLASAFQAILNLKLRETPVKKIEEFIRVVIGFNGFVEKYTEEAQVVIDEIRRELRGKR